MKFSFATKDQEDSFLKSRVETLELPDYIKNRLAEKRTVRGVVYLSDKELNKMAGSAQNADLVTVALEKLALEINYKEALWKIDEDTYEREDSIPESRSEESKTEANIDLENQEEPLQLESMFDSDDDDIVGTFAEYFGVDRAKIVSGARQHDLVYIRDLIVCILREYAEMSFPAIGRLLGRDHTTIIHSYRKLQHKFKTDEKLRKGLEELIRKARAIKDRKTHIEEKLIPDLIASIREKQIRNRTLKPVEIPERNLKILELYREGLTLQELGESSGVTRERARQIVITTIKQMALNDSISKGIELDADVILEEEKKKRTAVKNKGKIVKPAKVHKEKTWSRYYLACKSCGTTTIPHRRHGLCQKCTGQYGEEMRDEIIARHSDACDKCHISRAAALREYGRDFYITKDQQVLCRKCFLSRTGRIIGNRTRSPREA